MTSFFQGAFTRPVSALRQTFEELTLIDRTKKSKAMWKANVETGCGNKALVRKQKIGPLISFTAKSDMQE